MSIKKTLKLLLITIMPLILVVTTILTLSSFIKTVSYTNQSEAFLDSKKTTEAVNLNDQYAYIKNDVARQTGVNNTVASIELASKNSHPRSHNGAIVTKTDGSTLLYMWGWNWYGQIAKPNVGLTAFSAIPEVVGSSIFGNRKIKQLALGDYHTGVVLEDGSLYMWGRNDCGQLGLGYANEYEAVPKRVDFFDFINNPQRQSMQIALGGLHSAVYFPTKSFLLFMFGSNWFGQLSDPNMGTDKFIATPIPVILFTEAFRKVEHIALGFMFTLVVDQYGVLWTWGRNDEGQLGIGNRNPQYWPQEVPFDAPVTQIAAGSRNAFALSNGKVYSWGDDADGRTGLTLNTDVILGNDVLSPVAIVQSVFNNKAVKQIAAGLDHTMAMNIDGDLYTWGPGTTEAHSNIPAHRGNISSLGAYNNNSEVRMRLGWSYTMVQIENGLIYGKGRNLYGELGTGSTKAPSSPWLRYLGLDSHIVAKPEITAKAAVENSWVNGKFNEDGFKKSFNLINIPLLDDQSFVMDNPPTFDNNTGTVTMTIKVKYFYDENGLKTTEHTARKLIISGYTIPVTTQMTAKPTSQFPSVLPVVDKWKETIISGSTINRIELEKYLVLKDVPSSAKLTITNDSPNYKTGVLSFKIQSDQVMVDGKDLVKVSDVFDIKLQLIPRITTMTPITSGYPTQLTPSTLKTKLFDKNNKANIPELEKYVKITVPTPTAAYELVANSWKVNGGDGTVDFTVKATNFYNKEGMPSTTADSLQIALTLVNLYGEKSTIQAKSNLTNTVRVDKFLAYIVASGDTVVNSKLNEFFDLTNIPSTATYVIDNLVIQPDYINSIKNEITFRLTIYGANDGTGKKTNLANTYTLILQDQHETTKMEVNPNYDATTDIRWFYGYFSNSSNIVTSRSYLQQFVNFTSLPADAVLTITDKKTDEYAGTTEFKLKSTKAYGANSDPITNYVSPLLKFQLKEKLQPISVKPSTTATHKLRVDIFVRAIKDRSNTQALKNFLFNQYLVMDGDFPPGAVFSVDNVVHNLISGTASFDLFISENYQTDGELKKEIYPLGRFDLVFEFLPSKIEQIKFVNLDIKVNKFIDYLKDGGANLSVSRLQEYFELENIAPDAVFSIYGEPEYAPYIDFKRSSISFKISVSIFNYPDGRQAEYITQDLTFILGEQHQETEILLKNSPGYKKQSAEIIANIQSISGHDLLVYLDSFVNYQSIPPNTIITSKAYIEVRPSDSMYDEILLLFVVDQYYDIDGELIQQRKNYDLKLLLNREIIVDETAFLPWWIWLTFGLIIASIIVLVVVLVILKRQGDMQKAIAHRNLRQ